MSEKMPTKSSESNGNEKWTKRISNVRETIYPYAFYLPNGSAYVSVHFDGKIFARPGTNEDVDVRDFLEQMKSDLHVDKITLSCCYPDAAQKLIGDVPGITFIGSGDSQCRTVYNSHRKELTVENVPE